jgi:hypothetical protein
MTRSDLTDIIVVLDRSGSMAAIKSDTEGGFNAFIADQLKVPGEARVTLVQFDDQYELVYSAKDIMQVPELELKPRGMTALLDALGRTIVQAGERLAAMEESERPGKVIFVVLTDGLENSSKEWTREKVFGLITQQTEKYAWVFTYLGANQDAIAVGANLGFHPGLTLNYTAANVDKAFSAASHSVSRARQGGQAAYTSAEREAAE